MDERDESDERDERDESDESDERDEMDESDESDERDERDEIPKLLVFDLDCLFRFCINSDPLSPPFRKGMEEDEVVDNYGRKWKCHEEVPRVLYLLKNHVPDCDVAVVADTLKIREVYQLVKAFGWKRYIQYMEVFQAECKIEKHMAALREKTGIPYEKMVFFSGRSADIFESMVAGILPILTDALTVSCVEECFKDFSIFRVVH